MFLRNVLKLVSPFFLQRMLRFMTCFRRRIQPLVLVSSNSDVLISEIVYMSLSVVVEAGKRLLDSNH